MRQEIEIKKRIVERVLKSIYDKLDECLYGKVKKELNLTETYVSRVAEDLLWVLNLPKAKAFQKALIIVALRRFLRQFLDYDKRFFISHLTENEIDELMDLIKLELVAIKERNDYQRALTYWEEALSYLRSVEIDEIMKLETI